MYAENALAGTESNAFWDAWATIKTRLSQMVNVGPKIYQKWNYAKMLRARTKNPTLRAKLDDKISRLSEMYITWQEVKAKIDEWGPKWVEIDERIAKEHDTTQLGIIPLALPAWAMAVLVSGGLAAITFVANHGMSLLKEYQMQSSILDQVSKDIISAEEGARLIESGKPGPLIGMGTTLPLIGIAGLLAFMFMQKRGYA